MIPLATANTSIGTGGERRRRRTSDPWAATAHVGFLLVSISMLLPAWHGVASSLRTPRYGWEAAAISFRGAAAYLAGEPTPGGPTWLMIAAANGMVLAAYGLFVVRRRPWPAPWAWGVGAAVSGAAALLAASSAAPLLYGAPGQVLHAGYLVWTVGAACLAAGWTYARRGPVWVEPRRRGFAVMAATPTDASLPLIDSLPANDPDRASHTAPSRRGLIAPVAAVVLALLAIGVGPHVPAIRSASAPPPPPTSPAPPPTTFAFPRWTVPPQPQPRVKPPARRDGFETIHLGGGYCLRGGPTSPGGFTLWQSGTLVSPNVSREALPLVTPDGAVWFGDEGGRRLMRFHPQAELEIGPPDIRFPKPNSAGSCVTNLPLSGAGPTDLLRSIQLHPARDGWLIIRIAPPPGTAGPAKDELINWKTGAAAQDGIDTLRRLSER